MENAPNTHIKSWFVPCTCPCNPGAVVDRNRRLRLNGPEDACVAPGSMKDPVSKG